MANSDLTADPGHHHIKIDAEHFTIRVLVPVLTIALVVGAHILGLYLLGSTLRDAGIAPACALLPIDAGLFFAGSRFIEQTLKTRMPSRRSATLNDKALIVRDGRRSPAEVVRIDWGQTVNVKAWRFEVPRRTRVPKGWYCLAVRLLQDESEVILYTFMDPAKAEKLDGYGNFIRLRPRNETKSNTDLSAAAEQRRLLKLEDQRWEDGAEIEQEDFRAVLLMLERYAADWL